MFLLFVRFFSFYNLFLNLNLLKSIRIERNRSSNFVASLWGPRKVLLVNFLGKGKANHKAKKFWTFQNFKAKRLCFDAVGYSNSFPKWRENIVNLSVSVKSADFIGLLRTKFNNCFSLMLYLVIIVKNQHLHLKITR